MLLNSLLRNMQLSRLKQNLYTRLGNAELGGTVL